MLCLAQTDRPAIRPASFGSGSPQARLNCAMEVRKMVNHFPFGQDFVVLRDAMNQLLEESFVPARNTRSSNGTSTVRPLPLDVYTTPDAAVVIAAVPGMNPGDLEVTVNQSVVTVSGTVPTAAESEQGKQATWYLHELWHGQFRRSITLPFEVDASKADATF